MLSVSSLSYIEGGGGGCPGYVFISIPYNDWACEAPFATDGLSIDISMLASCDGKLVIVDFSNPRVSFLSDFSTPPICCSN